MNSLGEVVYLKELSGGASWQLWVANGVVKVLVADSSTMTVNGSAVVELSIGHDAINDAREISFTAGYREDPDADGHGALFVATPAP